MPLDVTSECEGLAHCSGVAVLWLRVRLLITHHSTTLSTLHPITFLAFSFFIQLFLAAKSNFCVSLGCTLEICTCCAGFSTSNAHLCAVKGPSQGSFSRACL